ncbi:MAG: phage holin family protein [Gemmiger sp.]|nr:phage holin family protein [Gemmiger sp.]
MDDKNLFLRAKAAIVAGCAGFSSAFGWLGWLVVAWVCCMALDWLTGSASGLVQHRWSSAVARAGIWHKAGMVAVVLVAALTDAVLGVAVNQLGGVLPFTYQALVCPVILCWYVFAELGSIVENARDMGAPVPEFLVALLAKAQEAAGEGVKGGGKSGES